MKSIMEEASTITKAIENAWDRAGQPSEFTVKILELPKTSFFGLKTAKSAKIALIFNEMSVKVKEQPPKQMRPLPQRQPQEHRDREQKEHSDRDRQPQRRPLHARDQQRDQQRPERSHEGNRQARPEQPRRQPTNQQRQPYRQEGPSNDEPRRQEPRTHERESWSPEMVESAQDWVKETLVLMGKPDIKVAANVSHNYLKLYLDQQVMDDPKQEETQLKSWGSLAMEAVREKAHKPLRSLRIILESNSSRSGQHQ